MDWLDPKVPAKWLAEFLELIRTTPNLDWLLLTKRPELWEKRLRQVLDWGWDNHDVLNASHDWVADWQARKISPGNVWIGTTVEDQERADERIPQLLKIPAKVRFLSCEPLLEHVQIEQYLVSDYDKAAMQDQLLTPLEGFNYAKVDWVIVGLESGPVRRDPGVGVITDDWDAPKPGVVVQCEEWGVPCFVKQDCAFNPGQQGRIPDVIWSMKEFPRVGNC